MVALLFEISTQQPKTNDWTSLSIAGQKIQQIFPEEIRQLKNELGCKSLKEIILTSELFEILEEPTKKGLRVLYRSKQKQ